MKRSALVVLCALVSTGAWAHDKWEFGQSTDDNPVQSAARLGHGVHQLHDLEGSAANPDQDWLSYDGEPRHSYEVRITGATMGFNVSGSPVSATLASLSRRDLDGNVLTAATGSALDAVLRWTETTSFGSFVLVFGSPTLNYGPTEMYEVEMTDTTVFAPRFNNAGSQNTILMVQNTTSATLQGSIFFYSAAGALLHTEPLSILPYGLRVYNSATEPSLLGQSGSVAIAHNGPYGAVTGKAVALEPNTGYTFDTAMVPMPR